MSDYRYLITAIEDGVGILQLNHPEKRNANRLGPSDRT